MSDIPDFFDGYDACVGAISTLASALSSSLLMYRDLEAFLAEADMREPAIQTSAAGQIRRIKNAHATGHEAKDTVFQHESVRFAGQFCKAANTLSSELDAVNGRAKALLLKGIAGSLNIDD